MTQPAPLLAMIQIRANQILATQVPMGQILRSQILALVSTSLACHYPEQCPAQRESLPNSWPEPAPH